MNTSLNPILVKQVEDKIVATFELAQMLFGKNFDIPTVTFNLNSVTIAGRANFKKNHIQINPKFLSHDPNYVINQTTPHECGHLISDFLYGDDCRAHGKEWKKVMLQLGLPPNRCHPMSLPGVVPKKLGPRPTPFVYKCACIGIRGEHKVTQTIHLRILRGGKNYTCRDCRKDIVFKEIRLKQILDS